jgi:hypothetical protein
VPDWTAPRERTVRWLTTPSLSWEHHVTMRASSRPLTLMPSVCVTAMLLVLLVYRALAQDTGVEIRVITHVPLVTSGARVTVDARVNGQGPFAFGLDIGASGAAWVTRALVEKLKLPLADGFVISDGSGLKGRRADRARIDAITLGSLSFNQLTATVLGEGPPQERQRGSLRHAGV